jgi:hypothetical protein
MHFVLVNHSKDERLTVSDLQRIGDAIESQTYGHYAAFCQSEGANVRLVHEYTLDPNVCPIHIFDSPEDEGYLGFHTFVKGQYLSHVFTKPIFDSGGTVLSGPNSLSATISHEVLEAIADPYCNWWADITPVQQEAIELCDRVQGDTYDIFGVTVSNFLGPRAFRNGPGPYDFMGLLSSPWEVRPGGYAIRRDLETGEVYNVWGEAIPDWLKTMKAKSPRLGRRKDRT